MSAGRAIRGVRARVVEGTAVRDGELEVVVEEPLEIRVAGESVALTMRTPGEDRLLALGFLFAEGVVCELADVGSVHVCGRTDDPAYGNVIDVLPGAGVHLDAERVTRARRSGTATSACGVCGRDGIADLLARLAPSAPRREVTASALRAVPGLLMAHQPGFARTGGLHAACAIAPSGEVIAHAEDVGRHNAVDKVVGKLLCAGLLGRGDDEVWLLAVSSRASFEIVQKAAVAGFACVASVSAPSSLAIEAARAAGLTLASFVREARFTLYTGAERVRAE